MIIPIHSMPSKLVSIIRAVDIGIANYAKTDENFNIAKNDGFKFIMNVRKNSIAQLQEMSIEPEETELEKYIKVMRMFKKKFINEICALIQEKSKNETLEIRKICIEIICAIKNPLFSAKFLEMQKSNNDETTINTIEYIASKIHVYAKKFTEDLEIDDEYNFAVIISNSIIAKFKGSCELPQSP